MSALPRILSLFLALLCIATGSPAGAQHADSTVAGPRKPPETRLIPATSVVRDTTKPPISPGRAFLSSLFIPGLGQSRLHRAGGGAVYFTFEALAAVMATKALYDLRLAKEHAADTIVAFYKTEVDAKGAPVPGDAIRNRYAGNRVKSRRTHVEDWVAALIFNHLFSGADAFVSAQLWELPIQLGFRAAPAAAILRAASRY